MENHRIKCLINKTLVIRLILKGLILLITDFSEDLLFKSGNQAISWNSCALKSELVKSMTDIKMQRKAERAAVHGDGLSSDWMMISSL